MLDLNLSVGDSKMDSCCEINLLNSCVINVIGLHLYEIGEVMATKQSEVLKEFEINCFKLLERFDFQKAEIARFKKLLIEKDAEILKLNIELNQEKAKNRDLLIGNLMSSEMGDVRIAEEKLREMLREVERCIALL